MRPLFFKELRALLPFLLLLAVLSLAGPVDRLLTEFVDQLDVTSAVVYASGNSAWEFVTTGFLVSMTLAAGLIVGEKDRGTLELLDALPTTRTQIFWSKVCAGWLILSAAPIFEVSSQLLLRALSRTSLDPSLHLDFLATGAFLHSGTMFALFGLALLLAYLRRFSWMVAALVILAYFPVFKQVPAVGILDPVTLMKPSFSAGAWQVPWRSAAVQWGIGGASYLIAYGLFLGWGDRLMEWLSGLAERRGGRALLIIGTVVTMTLWIVAIANWSTDDENSGVDRSDGIDGATFKAPRTKRVEVDRYVFRYRSDLAGRAQPMIDQAAFIHEEVRRRFEVEAVDMVDVDATSSLSGHGFAGLANWKAIKIDLSTARTSTLAVEILAHETAHVYVAKAGNRRFSDQHASTRFYNEGLAERLGLEISERAAGRRMHELRVATMRLRDQLTLEVLTDDAELTQRYDETLAYSMGLVFVDAVAARWGHAAPYALVRAMGRPEAPEKLSGLTLWRDTFQSAGMDFDEALARFFARADQLAELHRTEVEGLPRIQASVELSEGRIRVSPVFDVEPEGDPTVICRFRPTADASPSDTVVRRANRNKPCRIRRRFFPAPAVHVQLGILTDADELPTYEPWVEIPL